MWVSVGSSVYPGIYVVVALALTLLGNLLFVHRSGNYTAAANVYLARQGNLWANLTVFAIGDGMYRRYIADDALAVDKLSAHRTNL